jgi:N-acetylglucosamine-6-sulfatase
MYQVLQQSGQLDNTLLIFTSDNGFALGEHGRTDKRTAYEESLRIPLLLRCPRVVQPGTVIREMVLTLDLAPSIIDLCGAAPLPDADGQSFKQLLSGDSAGWRTAFFYQYNYEPQFPYTPNVRAIRTDRWKYIYYPHGDGGPDRYAAELYDLANDPLETQNLISVAAQASHLRELREELHELMQRHHASPDNPPLDGGIREVFPKY